MSLTFWVFTDGEGGSFFYMTTFLNADAPPIGSTYIWGTALLKEAGTVTSYDVGLCFFTFTDAKKININLSKSVLSVKDYWFTRTSPFSRGQDFAELLTKSLDENQDGDSNYEINEDMPFRVENITRSLKLAMNCPLFRYMNTLDYNDVKIEMSASLVVQGFYYMLEPDGETISVPDHGFGEPIKIEILDNARQSIMSAIGLILMVTALVLY